jgi:murein DD-endopeptidase MepM/ murein hydrolase activator NlpD
LEIETKMSEIELINAEIKSTELQMGEKETLIKEQKKKVAELIRLIHHYDSKSHLEIILLNKSLSDFFDFLKYSENIQNSLQKVLGDLQIVKQDLEIYRISLGDKRESLEGLKSDLERQDVKLKDEQVLKKQLLEETRGAEWKFQNLLAEAQKEWQAAEADIVHLEKTIRQRLAEEDEAGGWISGGTVILSWPVPKNKITCYFHEPDYLFRRWIGEHSGADIRAAQGTKLKAAASGYVGRAKDAGMGYSYIMIIHSNNIATVYGHVSKIYVKEGDYIKRGEVIGLTGGTPGTPGAGRFVTGPHLHLEVRLNGIPVNPLDYLL